MSGICPKWDGLDGVAEGLSLTEGVIRDLSETRDDLVFNWDHWQTQLFRPSTSIGPIRIIADPPDIARVSDLAAMHSVRANRTNSD